MRTTILAAAAVLGLGSGSTYAASADQYGYAQLNRGASAGATGTAAPRYYGNVPLHFGPNPWDGTESWDQWNKDHPLTAGGN